MLALSLDLCRGTFLNDFDSLSKSASKQNRCLCLELWITYIKYVKVIGKIIIFPLFSVQKTFLGKGLSLNCDWEISTENKERRGEDKSEIK